MRALGNFMEQGLGVFKSCTGTSRCRVSRILAANVMAVSNKSLKAITSPAIADLTTLRDFSQLSATVLRYMARSGSVNNYLRLNRDSEG
eukprot:IDg2165t1